MTYKLSDGNGGKTETLFDDFLYSVKEKPKHVLMYHTHSDVTSAKEVFEKYLTDYELQEEQLEGRYWSFGNDAFYILLDNELALRLQIIYDNPFIKEEVVYRKDYKDNFPDSLRGCYYND